MGNTALIATLAAAMVASVALVNADYSVLSSADALARDEQAMLSERSATSAFEMAASQLRRDFSTWRQGFPATSYLGGSFNADVAGPSTGPVRISASGIAADSMSTDITGWMSRLAAASGALTIDSDTAEVSFNGSGVLVSGTDHRSAPWDDTSEGTGLAEPVKGLLASREGTRYAVNQGLGSGSNVERVRGRDGDGDVALGGLPSDFATLLGEAVGSTTDAFSGDRTFSNRTFGAADDPKIVHVDGDATFVGGGGFGLLYVEGSFTASGDFAWEGLVIADGQNQMDFDLAGNATIRGAAYVTHTATTNQVVEIGNTSTPAYTLWSPDDERGVLRAYTFGPDGTGDRSEGQLVGWLGSGPQNGDFADSEALAFGPDGTLYIMDNPHRWDATGQESRLYKVNPDQLDGDSSTPVRVEVIGRSYQDRTNDNEIHGMVFYQGKLYGVGAGNRTIYDISLQTGRTTEVNSFYGRDHRGRNVGGLDARSLTADGDGNVYVTRKLSTATQLFKFDSFPDGDPHYVMTIPARLPGIGFHPDGYAYGYDATLGRIYQIDVEAETSSILGTSVTGDIEDMAIYFAGEMAAMGLNDSPRLANLNKVEGSGSYSQQVSWPGLGMVTVNTRLQSQPSWSHKSMVEGSTLQEFLDTVTASGDVWDLSGNKIGAGTPISVEYTGPTELPIVHFLPSFGQPSSWETIEFVFDGPLPNRDLHLYIADSEWFDVHIVAYDEDGDWVDGSSWTKETSVDVMGGDDGARTGFGWATRYSNAATLTDAGPGFVTGSGYVDSETIIDEIRMPNASEIRRIKIYTKSAANSVADRMGIGMTSRPIFEESGVLTVDMSDNASIRYSAEAIGKLAVNLPTIASASWFETFDQFASTKVDRMFGVERRVKRAGEIARRRVPVDTSSTGGTASGGGTGGTSSEGASVYVCHRDGDSRSTMNVPILSLPAHLAHGDTAGQCGSN